MINTQLDVRADRDQEVVAMTLTFDNGHHGDVTHTIARVHPVAAEDCDPALEWAERQIAALDNFISEVRLIQQRMETHGRLPEAPGWNGAGASVEAQRG